MSDVKRYGAGSHPAGGTHAGYTLEDMAYEPFAPAFISELARDLIAAQARIAELERAAERRAARIDWTQDRLDGHAERANDAESKLAAAEATIATALSVITGMSDLDYDDWTACTRALCAIAAALSPPAKGGE